MLMELLMLELTQLTGRKEKLDGNSPIAMDG